VEINVRFRPVGLEVAETSAAAAAALDLELSSDADSLI
jgi:hypothetical protein